MFGMVCGVFAGGALALTAMTTDVRPFLWLLGAGLILVRLLANMLDGMVAIAAQTASPVGDLYNEVPDRISDAATLIGLGYAAGGHMVLGCLAALAAVFTAYMRTLGRTAGAPQDFCGPMAKPQRMHAVILVALVSALLPEGWQAQVLDLVGLGIAALGLVVILAGSMLTSIRRLLHAAAYLRKSHA